MKKIALISSILAISLSVNAETYLAGYGELHYNNVSNEDNSIDKREIDFHRFVLFFGHDFSDEIRFFSEFELEHSLAGEGKPGEVELEQAYVEIDLNENNQLKSGLFLVPVGIINETHEPPTFYGVERNRVEAEIIPSTWWEAGIGLTGQFGEGFSYDLAIHSGLNVDATTLRIRSGRQKVAEAEARNLAATGRIKYTGTEGLELAATIQIQDDITQDPTDNVNGATLIEAHAIYNSGPFSTRALVAQWDIDVDNATSTTADTQNGGYIEVGYKTTEKIGVFARHSVMSFGNAEADLDRDGDDNAQTNIGINYWPHENVVLKADIQDQSEESGDLDGFNLGMGYNF